MSSGSNLQKIVFLIGVGLAISLASTIAVLILETLAAGQSAGDPDRPIHLRGVGTRFQQILLRPILNLDLLAMPHVSSGYFSGRGSSWAGKLRLPIQFVGPSKPRLLGVLGPGLITGASDDDPSGIATYSQAGAQFGFGLTWTMLFSYPLMSVVQEISARIGRTTGRGIAGNMRKYYPNWLLQSVVVLLLIANIINIGADLGAMGDALKLIIGGPALLYVILFGAISVVLQVFLKYSRYVSVLKWLTLSLFAYFGTVLFVHVPWGEVAQGLFIPKFTLDASFWTAVVAIFGTTISPYLFFWQASQEVEDQKAKPQARAVEESA